MKKLLSILMTVAMLASLLAVPANAFVPVREGSFAVNFVQDYSDESKTDFTTGYGEPGVTNAATIVDGKAVYVPNTKNNAMTLVSDVEVSATKFTVEFDVSVNVDFADFSADNGGYAFFFGTEQGTNPYAVEIYPSGMKANTVRTYKITIDSAFDADAVATYGSVSGLATVQMKDGDGEFTDVTYRAACDRSAYRCYLANYSSTAYAFNQLFLSPDNQFTLGSRFMNNKVPYTGELEITLDNIRIYSEKVLTPYEVTNGIKFTNDAEEAFVNGIAASNISCTQSSEDGNGYYALKPLGDGAVQVGLAMDDYLDYGQTLTFDLRNDNASSKSFKLLCYNATRGARVICVLISGLTPDTWYTYKFDVAEDGTFTVYRKLRGAADSTYTVLEAGNGWQVDAAGIGSFKGIYMGFRTSGGGYATTQYSIDNIQVRDSIAYAGNLSKTDATLVIDTPESTETVFMASYDGERLVDVDFTTLDGANNKAELSVDGGTSATKIFVWNLAEDGSSNIIMAPIEIQ